MSNKLRYKLSPLNAFSLYLIGYSIYFYSDTTDMFGISSFIIILLILTSISCFIVDILLQKITPKYLQLFIIELVIVVFIVFNYLVSVGYFSKNTNPNKSKEIITTVKSVNTKTQQQ